MNALQIDEGRYFAGLDQVMLREIALESLVDDAKRFYTQDPECFADVIEALEEESGFPVESFLLAIYANRDNPQRQQNLMDYIVRQIDPVLDKLAHQRAEKALDALA